MIPHVHYAVSGGIGDATKMLQPFTEVDEMIDWTCKNAWPYPVVVSYCGSLVVAYRDAMGLPEWKYGTEVPA